MAIATKNDKENSLNFQGYLLPEVLNQYNSRGIVLGNKRTCPIDKISNKDKEIHHTIK